MGASGRTLVEEIAISCAFLAVAVLGYKRYFWIVGVGMIGHGVFDLLHHLFIDNQGMPQWWPGFCMSFDVVMGVWLVVRTRIGRTPFLGPPPQ